MIPRGMRAPPSSTLPNCLFPLAISPQNWAGLRLPYWETCKEYPMTSGIAAVNTILALSLSQSILIMAGSAN